jgi:hypothetical protein
MAVVLVLAAQSGLSQGAAPSTANANSVFPLYRALRTVRLDPIDVFKVREAVIDRDDLHIFLNDGTVIFTYEVEGRITGMYFEGDGELLIRPPNRTERESLGLFTNLGVLENRFTHAYFRFNEDVKLELKEQLRPPVDVDLSSLSQFDSAAEMLADVDALRLLTSFTSGPATDEKGRRLMKDRFLHARLGGTPFGNYDVFYDTRSPEQIAVGQMAHTGNASFYDLWMSFPSRSVRDGKADGIAPLRASDSVHVEKCKIDATIHPPNNISAESELEVEVRQGGPRLLFFELSHELKLKTALLSGEPLEWLQNEALEGSQLARRGNDFVAVVLPHPAKAGEHLHFHFTYEGSVLSEAGSGLLYVGAHGIWYPNRGLTPTGYDLTFRYPQPWMLVAGGKKVSNEQTAEQVQSRWVTERPVPVAGFNLGKYVESSEKAGNVEVAAYGTHSVEKDFPTPPTVVVRKRHDPWRGPTLNEITVPLDINPSATTAQVAHDAANSIRFYEHLLGPYPFSTLKLTQFPGPDSQGWPSLIYLSSYSYLTEKQMQALGMGPFLQAFFGTLMVRHEVAHMWWGHEVFWDSYRDQWLSEALANYSALLMTQQDEPEKFRLIMEGYRNQLVSKFEDRELHDAGPVTLGVRLNSAKFPRAYDAITYGRGTWLIHMLRCMLEDETRTSPGKPKVSGDDLFIQVLRTLLKRHQDKAMSTDDVRRAFEEVWPESLRFEGRKSLDWFFDGWVNGTAVPVLELSGVKLSKVGTEEYVSGAIRQKSAPDDLVTSVPVFTQSAEKFQYLGRVFAVGEETRFRLKVRGTGRKIVLDPYHTILTRP